MPNGSYGVNAVVVDRAGNQSSAAVAGLTKNSNSPSFNLPSFSSGATATGTLHSPYATSYSMSGAGMVGTLTGTIASGATVGVAVPLTAGDGNKAVNVLFSTGASNYSASDAVMKDTVAPTVTVTSHSSGATFSGSSLAVSGTASDANGVASVKFN